MLGRRKHEEIGLRLLRWCTGEYDAASGGESREVLVAPDVDPQGLAGRLAEAGVVVGAGTMVFWPEAVAAPRELARAGATVVPYTGSCLVDEEEMLVAETLPLASVAYSVSPFVPVTGPTVVRLTEPADVEDFFQDADQAVGHGRFAEHLTHPLVRLGDSCAFAGGAGGAAAVPPRAFVTPEEVRCSPYGLPLGAGGDAAGGLRLLAEDPRLATELAARPWLGRYVAVTSVVAALRARGTAELQVSGFGHRFSPSVPSLPGEAAEAPVLVRSGEEFLLVAPGSMRVLRLAPDAARVAELVLAGVEEGVGTVELAAADLQVAPAVAAEAVLTVRERLRSMDFLPQEPVSA